jgi:AcrR family transcriptional regulator
MPERVKPKRSYHSPRRRGQAEATRRDILEAAERLFLRDGYGATSMRAIADAAGVAVKTVYLAFETKSGVLRALWNLRLRGDEADIPVGRRQWYQDVLAEPDPQRQLAMGARAAREVKVRVGPLFEVLRGAAALDRDIEALWTRIQNEFHANLRAVIESIAAKRRLAPGLDVDRATDILWMLNNPVVWQLLAIDRGWSPDDYEAWTLRVACEQLIAPAPRRRA